jgi:hypothetical protein
MTSIAAMMLAPAGERGLDGGGGDQRDRIAAQHLGRAEAVLGVERAPEAPRGLAVALGQLDDALVPDAQRLRAPRAPGDDVGADHALDMRMTREQRAIVLEHRDARVVAERDRGEEPLQRLGRDALGHHAEELAVRSGDPVRQHDQPAALNMVGDELDLEGRR